MTHRIFRGILRTLASVLLLSATFFASLAVAQTPVPNTGSYSAGATVYSGGSTGSNGCVNCHGAPLPNSASTGIGGYNLIAANDVANITFQISDQYSGDGNTCNAADMSQFDAACGSTQLTATEKANVAAYIGGFEAPLSADGSMTSTYNTATTLSTTSANLINNTTADTGTATGIRITTAPAHGTATVISGTFTIQYTPTTGYYGNDTFQYEAVNASGPVTLYSSPSNITVTMTAVPPPTVTSPAALAATYVTPLPINLASYISGTYTSVSITQSPTKGVLSGTGTARTYTPNALVYNTSDSFKFTATGPSGVASAAGTITINIGQPTAPSATAYSASVPNSGGSAVDLSSNITPSNLSASATITTAPSYGTLVSTGAYTFTYTPFANSLGGPDTFKFEGVGVTGEDSGMATGTLTVAGPSVPTASGSSTSVTFDSVNNTVPLSVSGPYTGLAVGTGPAHGTLNSTASVVTGSTVTTNPTFQYTPTAGYYGPDSFTYTASNPTGSSSTATVTITIPQPATPVAGTVTPNPSTPYNTPVTFNVKPFITGFASGVTVSTPTNGGMATVGTGANSFMITYTPSSTLQGGNDTFTYTAIGFGSNSSPGNITVTIASPGAPSATAPPQVSVGYGGPAVTVSLTPYVTSASSYTIAIGTPPSKGNAVVSGTSIIYTPSALSYGADSMTYTATNGGGTSSAATISFLIANPPPPTAATLTLGVNYATAATLNLTTGAGGRYNSVALNSALPATHGTVTLSGNVATYTPSPLTYFGADSFGYSVVGPTATTNAVVNVTVATPASPNANAATLGVAYQTAGNIDLSASVTGVFTTVGIVAQPAHGVVTLVGNTATYTPAALYYGQDTFTYNATGPGGTGGTGTVTVTVGLPPAPTITPSTVNVTFDTPATIALAPTTGGVITSFAITTAPTHGTASISGQNLLYTPTNGYYGTDTLAYTVTGPGGTSAPGTLTLNIVRPVAPQAAMTSANVPFNQPTVIDLTKAIAGYVTSIAITAQPQNGSVTVSGLKVTYTPNNGYFGADSFSYQAIGPGGTSNSATVSLNILIAAAKAANASMTVTLNGSGTINLANFITGSGITGVTVVSPPAHGSATVTGTTMVYRPVNNFFGQDILTYKAFGADGVSNIATITINVVGRPDPSQDADVQAIVASEMSSAERFGRAQMANFQSHLQSLHSNSIDDEDKEDGAAPGKTPGTPGAPGADGKGYSAAPPLLPPVQQASAGAPLGFNGSNSNNGSNVPLLSAASATGAAPASATNTTNGIASPLIRSDSQVPGSLASSMFGGASMQRTVYFPGTPPTVGPTSAPLTQSITSLDLGSMAGTMLQDQNTASVDHHGLSSVWVLGSVNFGQRTPGGPTQSFDTDGVSFGVDYRFSPQLVAGIGAGYGRDKTTIGNDGSHTRATGVDVAGYASYAPIDHTFIDAVVGYGSLDFDATRTVVPINAAAESHRDGDQVFASIAAGYEWHKNGSHVTPYVRLDASHTSLDQTTEEGAAAYDLTYGKQGQTSIAGALGLRLDTTQQFDAGVARPHITFEYQHEFENDQSVNLNYADLIGTNYTITPNVLDHNTVSVGFGSDFLLRHGLSIGWDYSVIHAAGSENSQMIRVKLSQDLDKDFVLPLVAIHPLADIRADMAYTYDDNVTRSTDKLPDQFWSLGLSRVFVLPFNENSRFTLEPSLGFDKYETNVLLSHGDAGIKAQLQYRSTGDFSSPTYALFSTLTGSNYESSLRDGERLQIGTSIFMPLTDRINGFAAIGADGRHARSEVWDGADGFVRANLDYALTESGTIYLSGEYRNGDMVSTGFASLANLDSAKIYVTDDAFPHSGRIAYRFNGTAGLFTLGYNLGASSTSSFDLSYRLVTSSPNHQPDYNSAPTIRYVDHQLSLVYLVRF